MAKPKMTGLKLDSRNKLNVRLDDNIQSDINFLREENINISAFVRRAIKEKVEQLKQQQAKESK